MPTIGAITGILLVALLVYLLFPLLHGKPLKEPFFGGIFNYPILFGIQLYFWLIIVGILFIVGCEIFWRFTYWDPMTPFHGIYKAFTDATKAAMVGDMNLDWTILSESAATIIFDPDYFNFVIEDLGWWIKFRAWLYKPDFSASIATQLEGRRDDPTMITIGKIPTHLIIDTEWWTDRTSKQRLAIKKAALAYNKSHPDDPQVLRFITFIDYVEKGLIEKPEEVVLEKIVPWARIDAAFPVIRSDAAWGGFVRQIAEDMQNASNADMNRWAAYVLLFGAGIIILMFASSWVFPHHAAAAAATVPK